MEKQLKIDFYQMRAEVDFDNIYSFCKFMETALKQEGIRFDEIYNSKINQFTAKTDIDISLIVAHWKLQDVFPTLIWNSLFNTSYAVFENHINELCNIFSEYTVTEVNLKDIAGQGIERAKTFISKVIGIKSVFNSTEWQEVLKYSKIRNILMHTSGKVEINHKYHRLIIDCAKNNPDLLLDPENPDAPCCQILILPGFIYDALLSYQILIGKICRCWTEMTNS